MSLMQLFCLLLDYLTKILETIYLSDHSWLISLKFDPVGYINERSNIRCKLFNLKSSG